jgi:hypothetical protein
MFNMVDTFIKCRNKWSYTMIKITLEDETGIVGYKDKNAWTYEDAIQMFQEIIKQVYDLPDNFRLEIDHKIPLTTTDESVITEGM